MGVNGPKLVYTIAICLTLATAAAGPVEGQGLLSRAREAARNTAVGRDLTRTAAEAQMLAADRIDLEESGLSTLAVGNGTLGISAVEVRQGVAVRLIGYLFNPAAQDATIALPDVESFVLIDSKGRRLDRLGELSLAAVGEDGSVIVPALERVEFSLLFDGPSAGEDTLTLKVGSAGVIAGIPLNGSAPPIVESANDDVVQTPASPPAGGVPAGDPAQDD